MLEEGQAELAGSVKLNRGHLFISTPNQDWPARIEDGEGYVPYFARLLETRSRRAGLRIKLTAFHDPDQGPQPRILLFPDHHAYEVAVEVFEEWLDLFFNGQVEDSGFSQAPAQKNYIFVCTHGTRDERCGLCGPQLVEVFQTTLRRNSDELSAAVYPCSHVGGHVYAGNVLIFPNGDWYGYVTPESVPQLVETHLLRKEIVWEHWRGRNGLTPEQQLALKEASQSAHET